MQQFFYTPYWPAIWFTVLPVIAVLVAWVIAIKGYALWTAARSGQKWWFVALLIFNTAGILELVYLFLFSPLGSNRFHQKKVSKGDSSSADKKFAEETKPD